MNTHQQPSGETVRDSLSFIEKLNSKEIVELENAIDDALTSHSEAMRERVLKSKYEEPRGERDRAEEAKRELLDWVLNNQHGMWNGDRHNPVMKQCVYVSDLLSLLTNP